MSALTLGIDCSTQSLTTLLLDPKTGAVVEEHSLGFDHSLPSFGTRAGQLPNDDPRVGHAPPLLWVAGLEKALTELAAAHDLGAVAAVAVSGQQHGSVYLNASAEASLRELSGSAPLVDQLESSLARATSPLWTDSTTTFECEEIRSALGGRIATTELLGSDTFERFTGPQIRRFSKTSPAEYEATCHIQLVSSFVTSLLAGALAPIDHGDGAGMNLMDIRSLDWSEEAMRATAPQLAEKLPPLVAPDSVIGTIHPSYVERFGFAKGCRVVAGTGDNPSSATGVGLYRSGELALSLGTSDTLFGILDALRTDPSGDSHVFVAPSGHYLSLLCFRNGSLAREAVRDRFALSWDQWSDAILETPPGNDGALLLPWLEPEIVPRVPTAVELSRGDLSTAGAACRAIVEGQLLSMRLHSRWMGSQPRSIVATGGGSENREILQIAADIFGCPVVTRQTTNGAALGAALRAAKASSGRSWQAVLAPSLERATPDVVDSIEPRSAAQRVYESLLPEFESIVREGLERVDSTRL